MKNLEMRMSNLKIVKDANIKELIEEPKEIKSPNWFNKSKLKKNVTIIGRNKFGYKNKIGEFKYIDIKDLVNNIKNNTISEIDAKKSLNAFAPDPKCKLNISSFLTLSHLLDCLICTRNSVSIVLLL